MRHPDRRRRHPKGFTLVELMVGAVIAFILVAAASELAAAMARSVKKVEEQSDLGIRMSLAHSFLQSELGAMAYNWNVSQAVGTADTGSLGAGNCATSTGICATTGGNFFPIRICNSATVDTATCAAPTTSTADALWTYTPRDPVVEALRITGGSTGTLPLDCSFTTNPASLKVSGKNSSNWAAGDFVLVSKNNHVSIGRLTAALAADVTDPVAGRTISIDLNPSSNTAGVGADDGGRTANCSIRGSLLGASVMRIQQVIVKLDETTKTLMWGTRNNSTSTLSFAPIVSNVDDFQVRFDIAKINATSKAGSFCTTDTDALWAGGPISTCGNEALNDNVASNINRVVGLRLALVMRTGVETENALRSIPYQFDRTGPAASDKRLRRIVNIYLGLPNASL
jgi:type II secretory pathway pseudopilin PulG